MPRAPKEWIGKTDDAKIPPRVRQRIYDRDGGVCHWCKIAIKAPPETWQADHVTALINGGEHRETNLAPIHSHCHIEKTGLDVADKKKVAAVRKKHIGAVRPKQRIKSAGFGLSAHAAKRESRAKDALPALLPKQLYERTVR